MEEIWIKYRAKFIGSAAYRFYVIVVFFLLLALLAAVAWTGHYLFFDYRLRPARFQEKLKKLNIPVDEKTFLIAVNEGNQPVVWMMLRAGMNPNLKIGDGTTVTMIAAARGHAEVVRTLLENGADINAVNSRNHSAISVAVIFRQPSVARMLKQYGATNEVSLTDAILMDDREAVEGLISAQKKDSGQGSAPDASISGSEIYKSALDEILLNEKSNLTLSSSVNAVDSHGLTPLCYASATGKAKIVDSLLKAGANVNFKEGAHGQTPLMLAAQNGHEKVILSLLQKGARIEERDKFGRTALMWSAIRGHVDVTYLLIRKAADLNVRDVEFGLTPLMLAAINNDLPTVEMLVNAGSDLKAQDKTGRTVLEIALSERRGDVALKLLEMKEDFYKRNPLYLVPSLVTAWKRNQDREAEKIQSLLGGLSLDPILPSATQRQKQKDKLLAAARAEFSKKETAGNLYNLIQALVLNRKQKDALELANRHRNIVENSAPLLALRARLWFEEGRTEAGYQSLQKAVSLAADYLEAQIVGTEIFGIVGLKNTELILKENAFKNPGWREMILIQMEVSLGRWGSVRRRIEEIKKMGKNSGIDPAQLNPILELAESANEYHKTLKDRMENDLKVPQPSITTLNNLAFLYATYFESPQTALPYARQAHERGASNPEVLDTLGYIHLQLGHFQEAERFLRMSEQMAQSPETAYHLGLLSLAAGQKRKAYAQFEEAQKRALEKNNSSLFNLAADAARALKYPLEEIRK